MEQTISEKLADGTMYVCPKCFAELKNNSKADLWELVVKEGGKSFECPIHGMLSFSEYKRLTELNK